MENFLLKFGFLAYFVWIFLRQLDPSEVFRVIDFFFLVYLDLGFSLLENWFRASLGWMLPFMEPSEVAGVADIMGYDHYFSLDFLSVKCFSWRFL